VTTDTASKSLACASASADRHGSEHVREDVVDLRARNAPSDERRDRADRLVRESGEPLLAVGSHAFAAHHLA
jgi:hypothetical protein